MSVAAALPAGLDVVLVEREDQLGAHSTGRSAALFYPSYGHPSSVRLAAASQHVLEDGGFLSKRGVLTVARASLRAEIESMRATSVDPNAEIIGGLAGLQELCSVLGGSLELGLYEPAVADIDVMALHASFVRRARERGVEVRRTAGVNGLGRIADDCWSVETSGETFTTRVVVNASGAWGDEVALMAGVQPVGLTPLRRTAFMTPAPGDAVAWPAVVELSHSWYFKPEGPQLLCSPAEEKPAPPGDPRPATEDVAAAIDRINAATSLDIRSVTSEWTGLRTFSPDQAMVVGFAEDAPGFFWLVGQGGTGIQTAPAAGQLAAALISGGPLPSTLERYEVRPHDYGIERLRR